MCNIKTVTLNGSETKVDGLSGQNTIIINKSSGAVYASNSPGIVPEADGVIEIPAGGRDGLYGTHGTLYLSGSGKVELRGTDYSELGGGSLSTGTGGSSGGGDASGDCVITKEAIDAMFSSSNSFPAGIE